MMMYEKAAFDITFPPRYNNIVKGELLRLGEVLGDG